MYEKKRKNAILTGIRAKKKREKKDSVRFGEEKV